MLAQSPGRSTNSTSSVESMPGRGAWLDLTTFDNGFLKGFVDSLCVRHGNLDFDVDTEQ